MEFCGLNTQTDEVRNQLFLTFLPLIMPPLRLVRKAPSSTSGWTLSKVGRWKARVFVRAA